MRCFTTLVLVISSYHLFAQIGYEISIGSPFHRFSYVNETDRDSGLNLYYRPSLYAGAALLIKKSKSNYGIGLRRGLIVYEIRQILQYDSTIEKSVRTEADRYLAFTLFASHYFFKNQTGSVRAGYEPYFLRKKLNSGILSLNYYQQCWHRKNRYLLVGAGLRYDTTYYPEEKWTTTTNNTQYAFMVRRNPISFQFSVLYNNYFQ